MFSNRKEVDKCIYEACEPISTMRLNNTMNKMLLRRKNLNNEEVWGNQKIKEKDNKKAVQNMKVKLPIQ